MTSTLLLRPRDGRILAGVCAGIARRFGLDANIVRLLWVLATCAGGAGFLVYLVCWFVIPVED